MKQLTKKQLSVLLALAILLGIFIAGCIVQQAQNPGRQTSANGPSFIPIISRGVPAFASSGTGTDANDRSFDTLWWSAAVSRGNPSWLAYDLSGVPVSKRGKVLLVWYNETFNYDHTVIGDVAYNMPGSYTIDLNFASGGTSSPPASGWKTVVTVAGNHYHSRQHVFDMHGANWVRINVTVSDGSLYNYSARMNVDIYDASHGLTDDFIDFGDSITATTMSHTTVAGSKSFGDLIHDQAPKYFPVQENGGIADLTSATPIGPQHHYLQAWLSIFPGTYVGLTYGTNDSFGCSNPADIANSVYGNDVSMVQAVLAAGKIPVVPHMIWSPRPDLQTCAAAINVKIDQLYKKYPKVIPGPDLYATFQNHPEYFFDSIHPNDKGVGPYRQAWANMFLKTIYHWQAASSTSNHAFTAIFTFGAMLLNRRLGIF